MPDYWDGEFCRYIKFNEMDSKVQTLNTSFEMIITNFMLTLGLWFYKNHIILNLLKRFEGNSNWFITQGWPRIKI